MKALTLHQPWASLIAIGVKRIETRSWSTSYRGPLAIHGAKRPLGNGALSVGPWTNVTGEPVAGGQQMMSGPWDVERQEHQKLVCPLGAIVATCELVDVVPIAERPDPTRRVVAPGALDGEVGLYNLGAGTVRIFNETPFGDFTPGRFAWLLDNITPLDEPIPARGRQGLWTWEPAGPRA